MRLASLTCALKEERFIGPFLDHLEPWVDERLVLNSAKPWFGEPVEDGTAEIAKEHGATVIRADWKSEEEQRNAGVARLQDYDWIIVLDPDEFILDWEALINFLEVADEDAYVCQIQHTYWKKGYVIDPPEDYKQIIAIRPWVGFADKRVVNSSWAHAPIDLHHFSWARTDEECWNKISHYAHAKDFNIKDWYDNVWKKWTEDTRDFHPVSPEALHRAVRVNLPEGLEGLWPSTKTP